MCDIDNKGLLALLEKYQIIIEQQFIPFSKSRSKGHLYKSFNWRVTLFVGGKEVLSTLYSAGAGYGNAYKATFGELGGKNCVMRGEEITKEVETGLFWANSRLDRVSIKIGILDFMNSLILDSEAVFQTFEDWAEDLGYDSDSMKAKNIYDDCLETGEKFLAGLGMKKLEELKEAFSNY